MSATTAKDKQPISSFVEYIKLNTKNQRLIELAQLCEISLGNKDFIKALNAANEGSEIAKKARNELAYLGFHEYVGQILIEICLVDIKTAYELGMTKKAHEIYNKCLITADNSFPGSNKRFITLMLLKEIVVKYDPKLSTQIDDELAAFTVKGIIDRSSKGA